MSVEKVTINVSSLSNGASLAIELYSQGVDITAKAIAQSFASNIPFMSCAKHARDMVGVDKSTIIQMMKVEERASKTFSEVWAQGVDSKLSKEQIKINAIAASNEVKAQGIAGLTGLPVKKSVKGINPLPAAKVNPAVELAESLLIKFDGVGYRVGKKSIKGVWRVSLQNKNTKNPLAKLEGQTIDMGIYGKFQVLKTGDVYANLEPIANTTPTVTAETTPTTPAQTDDSAIAQRVDKLESMLAKILAAVE
jgi:hypothetical protein